MGIRFNSKSATAAPATTTNLVTAGVGAADDTLTSIAQIIALVLANIPDGANPRVGTGTLVAGTVTIANTSVTANSLIYVTPTTGVGAASGVPAVTAKVAGTSFTVSSPVNTDTYSFNYLIIN